MKASQPGSKSHRVYPWCIFLDSSNYSSLALLTKTDSLEHWLASVYVWIIWISESSHVLTFSQLIWCFLKFQNQVQILTPVYLLRNLSCLILVPLPLNCQMQFIKTCLVLKRIQGFLFYTKPGYLIVGCKQNWTSKGWNSIWKFQTHELRE